MNLASNWTFVVYLIVTMDSVLIPRPEQYQCIEKNIQLTIRIYVDKCCASIQFHVSATVGGKLGLFFCLDRGKFPTCLYLFWFMMPLFCRI